MTVIIGKEKAQVGYALPHKPTVDMWIYTYTY